MRDDPDLLDYKTRWRALYRGLNDDAGAAGYFLAKSHEWAERRFGPDAYFPDVLELGAGSGQHHAHVRHRYDRYVATDLVEPDFAHGDKVITRAEDAARLSFADASFDRVIAAHVLEHIVHPHEVLREWHRVLKPRGIMTLVLPCDPGLAWRMGRALGSRRRFVAAGIDYDYWMAREHVNSITNLVALIEYYFEPLEARWMPLRIPSSDLNLFYIAHIEKATIDD